MGVSSATQEQGTISAAVMLPGGFLYRPVSFAASLVLEPGSLPTLDLSIAELLWSLEFRRCLYLP